MKLRLSARGAGRTSGLVHLTVMETMRVASATRKRGDALCRPRSSLPNLDVLDRQTFDGRSCCESCVDIMRRLRLHTHIELPPACGRVAGDLIKELDAARETTKVPRPRKSARAVAASMADRPADGTTKRRE